ncbi:MAG: VacJ family lipoprotein [Arcobacteraceae bacterium]|jgi:phospholipid-binding lipoprotein MlaA|nr:VacJ family lipoprotein [Arcobacteraceae bacterium]MDY0326843.1 VacJ family lipoprotein [Arcobacteraceae bacterium]
MLKGLVISIFVTFSCINLYALPENMFYENLSSNEDDSLESFNNEFDSSYTTIYDPLSGYNKLMTSFNDSFYLNIAYPVARGYKKVVPKPARTGISNFFHNIFYPIRLINNLLQLKFKNSVEETGRFLINSTIGIVGFMDVAKDHYGLEPKSEDLGQTLGVWGIGSGPHIVLPFVGSSNLRDFVGLVGDGFINPLSSNSYEPIRIPNSTEEAIGLKLFDTTNTLSHNPDVYEVATKDSINLYIFLRDSYEQRRNKLIQE